jgi:hypothetical protein
MRKAHLPDQNYFSNRSARELQAKLIAILFQRFFGIRMGYEEAFVLSYYRHCDYVCKRFIEFVGIQEKKRYNTDELKMMASLFDLFVAHIRVRTGHFPAFRYGHPRWSLKNIIRFFVLLVKGELYNPNRLYWFRYFRSESFVSKNIYLPKAQMKKFKQRIRIAEDKYLLTLKSSRIRPMGNMWGVYIIQCKKLFSVFKEQCQELQRMEIESCEKSNRRSQLANQFTEVLGKIDAAYMAGFEKLKGVESSLHRKELQNEPTQQ